MERVFKIGVAPHPEDHKPGHCDCSCFGRGMTFRYNEELKRPTACGRVVSRDEDFVYIDWYETFSPCEEPENWHADPWPLSLYSEHIRPRKKR